MDNNPGVSARGGGTSRAKRFAGERSWTSEFQILRGFGRQAPWADPSTVLPSQGVSRLVRCFISTPLVLLFRGPQQYNDLRGSWVLV